jgi:hypothetical protein
LVGVCQIEGLVEEFATWGVFSPTRNVGKMAKNGPLRMPMMLKTLSGLYFRALAWKQYW